MVSSFRRTFQDSGVLGAIAFHKAYVPRIFIFVNALVNMMLKGLLAVKIWVAVVGHRGYGFSVGLVLRRLRRRGVNNTFLRCWLFKAVLTAILMLRENSHNLAFGQ